MGLWSAVVWAVRRGAAARGLVISAVAGAAAIVGGVQLANAQECDPVEVAKLLADDGSEGDAFGISVSIDGDTAVIGAHEDDDNGTASGSAYVFIQDGGIWRRQAKLLPADGSAYHRFGHSVSISNNTIVVGANSDDNGDYSGSVYVYTRQGEAWTLSAKLLPGDGGEHDRFGTSVSIRNNTVIIGADSDGDNGHSSGSAYVFTRSDGVWTERAKLLPDDGAQYAYFGCSVALDGDTAIIGARRDYEYGHNAGAAYIFVRNGDVWTQQAKLVPDDAESGKYFGESVSIDDNTVVIGARWDDHRGSASGSAYVFSHSGNDWTQQAKLIDENGAQGDHFGSSVSIDGETILIGAFKDDRNGANFGSAYVFARSEGTWSQLSKILPDDGAIEDRFGSSVALCGEIAVIGAVAGGIGNNETNTGSAYIFDLNCTTCPADLTGDDVIDTRDFVAFLNAWAAGDTLADWDENDLIDTRDFVAYLNDWVAGCP